MFSVCLWEMFCSTFCQSTDYRNPEKAPLWVWRQLLNAEWALWTNDLCWNIYVFQHLLTHCIFPTHQKLRFFSVKWSRNQSKLMADLAHLCAGEQPASEATWELSSYSFLVLPDSSKMCSWSFQPNSLRRCYWFWNLRLSILLLPATAECREDKSGFWKLRKCGFLMLI